MAGDAAPGQLPAPRYGERALSDLLPSMVAALAVASRLRPPAEASLDLAPVRKACLLLVDGLGWTLLREHPRDAPFLTSLLEQAVGSPYGDPLEVGFPATTATSLASLGTGRPPGAHGVVGLDIAVPGAGWVLSSLTWDERIDPRRWQPEPTWFERAAAAGIGVTRVGPAAFDGSGLTEAALRGGRYVGGESAGERVASTLAALRRDDPALVYCYHGDLDGTGHRRGCASSAWRYELASADRMAESIAAGLPAGSALWVTADHGMVDVPRQDRVDLAGDAELDAGIRLLAGEPRARYLHTLPGAEADVLATWRERLGARMAVLSREEAIDAGWFGPVAAWVAERIGDVVAVSRDLTAVVDSRRMPKHLLALVGMHGAMTPDELLVPLLEVRRD